MHDIDRTPAGYGHETENFSYPEHEYGMNESENEATSALMGINSEEEFEYFLGDLLGKAAQAVGGFLTSQTGQSLGSLLKGAARQILPVVSQALGGEMEYEDSEGGNYSEAEWEEREWEAANTFVKLVNEAAQIAAQEPPNADPDAVANKAVAQAAQVHAPALLGPPPQPGPPMPPGAPMQPGGFPPAPPFQAQHHHHRRHAHSGRWVRRGREIILYGV
jgi:hypothetical protein